MRVICDVQDIPVKMYVCGFAFLQFLCVIFFYPNRMNLLEQYVCVACVSSVDSDVCQCPCEKGLCYCFCT